MNKYIVIALGICCVAVAAFVVILNKQSAVAPAVTIEKPITIATSTATTSLPHTPKPAPKPVTPPTSNPTGSSPANSPFGAPFTLKVGAQMVLSDGLRVTLTKIDDSRCKAGVQCVWAGELSPTLSVVVPADSFTNTTKTVTLGSVRTPAVDIENYHIVLGATDTGSATFTITKTGIASASVVGTVSGTVTFNHVCPVEQQGVPCETPRSMYDNRNAVAYLEDGVTLAGRVLLNPNGTYAIQLPPGSYLIQIDPAGIGAGEKKPVTIEATKTTTVNFDIDTGIR